MYQRRQLLIQKQPDNNEDRQDITAQLQAIEHDINLITSNSDNFNQNERHIVVGTPKAKDNQRVQMQLLGKYLSSLQYEGFTRASFTKDRTYSMVCNTHDKSSAFSSCCAQVEFRSIATVKNDGRLAPWLFADRVYQLYKVTEKHPHRNSEDKQSF